MNIITPNLSVWHDLDDLLAFIGSLTSHLMWDLMQGALITIFLKIIIDNKWNLSKPGNKIIWNKLVIASKRINGLKRF